MASWLQECLTGFIVAFNVYLSRDLVEADRYAGMKWMREGELRNLGYDPKGKVRGIVGLGRIGFEVAKRVQAFGMRILY